MKTNNPHILSINIEASNTNGEDSYLIYSDDYSKFIVLGVFDGLGGRSAGFAGKTGGQIASQEATQITARILKQWKGELTEDIATELRDSICKSLKSQADSKMEKSRLSGTLTGKRLCTTIALACVPKQVEDENNIFEISFAWMGDSRVYFLSPKKGLQQLTVDDLEIEKDAFQMIREDPRMSQYLTADIPSDWQIHFSIERFDEKGCILVCTDGCFQYLPTPWDFEKLLITTLINSSTPENWKNLLVENYEKIKQDDISLALYRIGFDDFDDLKNSYQERLQFLSQNYEFDIDNSDALINLWNSYRLDYEVRIKTKNFNNSVKDNIAQNDVKENSVSENSNQFQSNDFYEDISTEANRNTPPRINTSFERNEQIELKIQSLLKQALNCENYNNISEAISKYHEVLSLNTNNTLALFYLGRIYLLKLEKYQESITYFEQLINSHLVDKTLQIYVDSLGFIAQAYYSIKDEKQSFNYFEKLYTDIPHYKFSDWQLKIYVQLLLNFNQLQKALTICDRILQRNREDPFAFYIRGSIFHRNNNFQYARQELTHSFNLYQRIFERNRNEYYLQMVNKVYSELQEVNRKLNESHPSGGY